MQDNERHGHKTIRIGILCMLCAILGILFFCYKIQACDEKATACRDEFFELKPDDVSRNMHACSPGAYAELVMSPPAPRPGMICHCTPVAPKPAP